MSIFKRNQDPPFNLRSPVNYPGPERSSASTAAAANVHAAVTSRPAPASERPEPVAVVSSAPAPAPAPAAAAAAPAPPEIAAVVDNLTEITGTLHSDGNVLIEGIFHGEIVARETVWIEEGAQSQGQVRANDVVIAGAADGEITCEHRLQVSATAVVTGDIKTPLLVIEEGATINCRFDMQPSGRVTR